jgi:hypothetical protein
MTQRRLVSSGQAVHSKQQHKVPCSDCPWARKSLPGWLGSLSADEWLAHVTGESFMKCHVFCNQQCAGAAIFRRNITKLPVDAKQLKLEKDRDLVFSNPAEFKQHHDRLRQTALGAEHQAD